MNAKLRVAAAFAALMLVGTAGATVRDHPVIGKPSATSPPAAVSTTGVVASVVAPATTGKPSATSPPFARFAGQPTMVASSILPVVPHDGKPSATSPPA